MFYNHIAQSQLECWTVQSYLVFSPSAFHQGGVSIGEILIWNKSARTNITRNQSGIHKIITMITTMKISMKMVSFHDMLLVELYLDSPYLGYVGYQDEV